MKDLKFDGVGFNAEFYKGKKEADFLSREKHTGLSEAQLKEAFKLINPSNVNDTEPVKELPKPRYKRSDNTGDESHD